MDFTDTIAAVAIALQTGGKVFVASGPGEAKTALGRAAARAINGEFFFLGAGGTILPESISVPTVPEKQGEGIFLEPRAGIMRLKRAVDEGRVAVIMADEITRATVSGQNAMLAPMQDGQFGDVVVNPARVAWFAAYNPTDTDIGTVDIGAALSNRATHLDWNMPFEYWRDAALAGFPDPVIPVVPTDWEAHIGKFQALILGFLNANRPMAKAEPKEEAARCKPWPSYRSWTNTWRLRAACHAAGSSKAVEALLIRGTVGEAAFIALKTYESRLDLPDPEKLLLDPANAKLPKNADQLFVTAQSVAGAVASNPTPDRWLAGYEVLCRVSQAGDAGIAISAVRVLGKLRDEGKVVVSTLPTGMSATLVEALKESGLQKTR